MKRLIAFAAMVFVVALSTTSALSFRLKPEATDAFRLKPEATGAQASVASGFGRKIALAQTPAAAPTAAAPDPAFLKQYCFTCHNERMKAGSFVLTSFDPTAVEGHAEVWEKV